MTDAYRATVPLRASSLLAALRAANVPRSFVLELTARCTNDCRHCYINLPAGDCAARERELTVAEIMDLAGQAVELGALWCLLTGGDPLLRDDFAEIYTRLKRLGLLVSVYTNATLISEAHARLWRELPPRDLEVTVYGVTEATYARVTRRPGSFAAFQRGLALLEEYGVPVHLKAMALRGNFDEFPAIVAFCRAHTKGAFRFDAQLHLRVDGNAERNEEIRAERLTPEEVMACERLEPRRLQALQERCARPPADTDDRRLFRCGAGIGNFAISYEGQYRLCLALTASGTTYDLRDGTLREAWQDFTPSVRARQATAFSCGVCALSDLCMNCPAHAFLETGDMAEKVEYFCAIARARSQVAGS